MPKPLSHWTKAEESRADEQIRQKTIRHSEPMKERNVNRRNRDLKSGRRESKRKTTEEDGTEESHRHDRRVTKPRAVSSLVKKSFPKTAEEESRGLESLRVRVRGRVSEFAEIPGIVCVCGACAIYIHTCARGSVSSLADKNHIYNLAILKTSRNHARV